ncbi:MAG: hypothetical protein GY884_24365 [Proteobacteria bacterium]|nr:hypothetical protein [Pseudomonadota bacterium]
MTEAVRFQDDIADFTGRTGVPFDILLVLHQNAFQAPANAETASDTAAALDAGMAHPVLADEAQVLWGNNELLLYGNWLIPVQCVLAPDSTIVGCVDRSSSIEESLALVEAHAAAAR